MTAAHTTPVAFLAAALLPCQNMSTLDATQTPILPPSSYSIHSTLAPVPSSLIKRTFLQMGKGRDLPPPLPPPHAFRPTIRGRLRTQSTFYSTLTFILGFRYRFCYRHFEGDREETKTG